MDRSSRVDTNLILDITAGNRHIWGGWRPNDLQDDLQIVFCDIEPNLRRKPDIICDAKKLPFREKISDGIVFDPPCWSFGSSRLYGDPQEKWKGSWWGNFKNETSLMRLISGISKEIVRCLKDDGKLYFKWTDGQIALERVLPILKSFFMINSQMQRGAKSGRSKVSQTYWLIMSKT